MVDLKNISLSFGSQILFDGFSLEIQKGEKIAITGRSGTGKTSVLNLILGFVKPQKGEVTIDKMTMNKHNIKKIRQKMVWLPQNYNVLGSGHAGTVVNHLFSFHHNKHILPDSEKLDDNLKKLALSCDILNNSFENLSGGERQRIGIMMCKMLKRDIIILDEPTSALDKESISLVSEYILSDKDLTVVSVSHEDEWFKKCNKIVEIENGKQ